MSTYVIYGSNHDRRMAWKLYPDTPEGKAQALSEGCSEFSIYSFEFEPGSSKGEPNRKGDLWIDFDDKYEPFRAIVAAQCFLQRLEQRYDLQLGCVRYFLSGSKGCHICIPAACFGGENGSPLLPHIHRTMLNILTAHQLPYDKSDEEDKGPIFNCYIDRSLFSSGKGHLLREKNIRRPDGRYKVEIDPKTFFALSPEAMDLLTREPNQIEILPMKPQKCKLEKVYAKAVELALILVNHKHIYEALFKCSFITHCLIDSATLSEPEWFRLIAILSKLDAKIATSLIHIFSKDYPYYDHDKTIQKINHAAGYTTTCTNIKEIFDCPSSCDRNHPLELCCLNKKNKLDWKIQSKEDGLYLFESEEDNEGSKISSPLELLGKIATADGTGWSRYFRLINPNGIEKNVVIKMKDLVGTANDVMALFFDYGLEVDDAKNIKHVLEFVRSAKTDIILIEIKNFGWDGDCFYLPDHIYTYDDNKSGIYLGDCDLFSISGTLGDWQTNIGNFCKGNRIMQFVCGYAVSGPLLARLGMEGGGFHLYGPSSTSKTTLALVAGSVVGGNSRRGFIKSWRATSNSMEKIAFEHNDLFLVLDELSQTSADAAFEVAYMFSNNQGKSRMRSDGSLRQALEWRINFLSTGEVTLADKIEESGKHKVMAGQEVRLIDIFIKDGCLHPETAPYDCLHGFDSAKELSDHLKKATTQYWGTPLRRFLAALFGNSYDDLQKNVETIRYQIKQFVSDVVPDNASGQVHRVADRFGLVAAAGAFAAEHGVFPWDAASAIESAKRLFQIWLDKRGSMINIEVEKSITEIYNYIEKYKGSRFFRTDYDGNTGNNFSGYYKDTNDAVIYYFLQPEFNRIINRVNAIEVRLEMMKRGLLELDKKRKIKEYLNVKGVTERVYGVIVKKDTNGEAEDQSNTNDVANDSYKDMIQKIKYNGNFSDGELF